jgi:hypothetical protein
MSTFTTALLPQITHSITFNAEYLHYLTTPFTSLLNSINYITQYYINLRYFTHIGTTPVAAPPLLGEIPEARVGCNPFFKNQDHIKFQASSSPHLTSQKFRI